MHRGYVDDQVMLGAFIPAGLKRELVNLAVGRGHSLSEEVRVALRQYVETKRPEPKGAVPA